MKHFSVLISVYYKDNPLWLREALESIFTQTLLPNEVVLVKDGPLTSDLDKIIDELSQKHPIFKIVFNETNLGLGPALQRGVLACNNELIARMDSDDISYPDRFEKQIPLMHKGYDVVSSWSIFFEDNVDNIIASKKRPEHHHDIKKLAKKKSPICHACSIIRKSKVIEAGNYRNRPYYEDYDLWVRMLMNNATFYNLQEYIYYVRSSKNQFGRRGGLSYLKTEITVHWGFKKMGFINLYEFTRNIFIRAFVRLSPTFLRRSLLLVSWKKTQSK